MASLHFVVGLLPRPSHKTDYIPIAPTFHDIPGQGEPFDQTGNRKIRRAFPSNILPRASAEMSIASTAAIVSR